MVACGEHPSPISARDLGGRRTRLGEGYIHDRQAYWLQSDPQDKGRTSLVTRGDNGALIDLTPTSDLRTHLHSYGGGALGHRGSTVCFYDRYSTRVWVQDSAGMRPITDPGEDGLGGFSFLSDHEVVCVRESLMAPVVESLVVLDLDSGGISRTLTSGADFYFSVTCSPGGWIAWMEYDHPSMPWGTTRIMVRTLDGETHCVAGGDGVSSLYPQWVSDGVLVFLCDESGYWNFYQWSMGEVTRLHEHNFDFCEPPWTLSGPPYAILETAEGIALGCSWWEQGEAHLGILDTRGCVETLTTAGSVLVGPASDHMSPVVTATPTRPYSLNTYDWGTRILSCVARESDVGLDDESISIPEYRRLSLGGGDCSSSAWFYPAQGDCQETPPVVVMAHSGPTSYSPAVFSLVKQFFTSRGIGVLDVNYVGSTTMGRRSRQSLNGQWGVVDVSDCVQHALGLVADGKADPKRLAIMGSSAGGFTALAAATTTTVFSACISLYGIADLALLDTYSERFESHYTSTLLGASSRDDPIWAIRSPIKHVDQLSCPILLLQGEDDTVVLPHQAHVMFQAAQERGFDAEVIVFPGEGHGFRQASTIERAYQAILDFLGHTWGFTPDASSDTSPVHQG